MQPAQKEGEYRMAATATVKKIACNLLLNNGTTQTGAVKTATISMGTLDKDAFDADKALALVNLITPCLEKSLYECTKVETSKLQNS